MKRERQECEKGLQKSHFTQNQMILNGDEEKKNSHRIVFDSQSIRDANEVNGSMQW